MCRMGEITEKTIAGGGDWAGEGIPCIIGFTSHVEPITQGIQSFFEHANFNEARTYRGILWYPQ